MPTYYAAGVTTRLSLASLAASTTATAIIKCGREANNNVQAAEWSLQHGQDMKEHDVRCFGEDGRLHFIGKDREVPFLCVAATDNDDMTSTRDSEVTREKKGRTSQSADPLAINEVQDEQVATTRSNEQFEKPIVSGFECVEQANENPSCTSRSPSAVAPGSIPDDATKCDEEVVGIGEHGRDSQAVSKSKSRTHKASKKRRHTNSQDVHTITSRASACSVQAPGVPKARSLTIKLKARRTPVDQASEGTVSTAAVMSHPRAGYASSPLIGNDVKVSEDNLSQPSPAASSTYDPESDTAKALTITTRLSSCSFTRRSNGCSEDLKIDVFFNGTYSGCAYISQRDKANANALTLRFSGRRTNRVLERAWVYDPAAGCVNIKDATYGQEDRQNRWNGICTALQSEADHIGFDNEGNRPPTGHALESLSLMPLPELGASSSSVAAECRFGVIDVLVTLGDGKKFSTAGGYLVAPQRLRNEHFWPKYVKLSTPMTIAMKCPEPASPVLLDEKPESTPKLETTVSQHPLHAIPATSASADGIARLRAELCKIASRCTTVTDTPSSRGRAVSTSLLSWSSTSERVREPVPPLESPASARGTTSPPVRRQVAFAVVIPCITDVRERTPDTPDKCELVGGVEQTRSLMIEPPQKLALGQEGHTFTRECDVSLPSSTPKAMVTLVRPLGPRARSPSQRLGRNPFRLIDQAQLPRKRILLEAVQDPFTGLSQTMFQQSAAGAQMTSGDATSLPSFTVFGNLSKPLEMQAGTMVTAAAVDIVQGCSRVSAARPNLKRKITRGPIAQARSRKRIRTNKRTLTVEGTFLTPYFIPSMPLTTVQQMPPPPVPAAKSDEFVVPSLCENCCITYAEPAENNNGGTRQIRKERGGTFKEREVLVAMRFIVGW